MKLKDIINKLDKTDKNACFNCVWDLEHFIYELGLSCSCVEQDRENQRLKSYWVANHYCTDTYVGIRAYFLDDEFVCLSTQMGRKCDEDIEWFSISAQKKVREYILSLEVKEDFTPDEALLNMEEDLGEGYPINYVGQLLTKEVLYKGVMVEVVKEDRYIKVDGKCEHNFHKITVKQKDTGIEENIDIRDILVPWKVK